MEEILIKLLIGFITSVSGFLFIRNVTNSDQKFFSVKVLFWLIILSLVTPLIYKIDYKIINPIVSYLSAIFIYKKIFDFELSESTLLSGFLMLILFLQEILFAIIFLKIFTVVEIRSDAFIMIVMNALMGIFLFAISKTHLIKNKIISVILKKSNNIVYKIVLFLSLAILLSSLLFYVITHNYILSIELIVALISAFIALILVYSFVREQIEYGNLQIQMQALLKPVCDFEDWLESERINKHEYRNNLAVLRSMIDNKEAQKFIDDKLNNSVETNLDYSNLLKNIPTGGLKGLLFYKILESNKQSIDILINVSNKSESYLNKITGTLFQNLCYLLGIFLDNAIESAALSDEKRIAFEVYPLNKTKIKIVISNTFSGNLNLKQIYDKGYSTKGKGRGKGLYYARRIANKSRHITLNNKVINDFYIQEIIITLDE